MTHAQKSSQLNKLKQAVGQTQEGLINNNLSNSCDNFADNFNRDFKRDFNLLIDVTRDSSPADKSNNATHNSSLISQITIYVAILLIN